MITSFVLLCAAVVLKRFPPKRINMFYGYPTAAGRRNIYTWRFANNYASTWMIRISLVLCMLGLAIAGYNDSYMLAEKHVFPLVPVAILFVIIKTEKALNTHADRIDAQEL
jgi:uncharacterized membrane protein